MVIKMKHMSLKSKKDNKKIKKICIVLLFILSTIITFNYLNKNIYDYNTKEYLNIFTRLSFSFENTIDIIINKIFDFYDNVTNTEVVKR
jgi:hypothetical protein